ncbi:MAG: sugar phosphate isomerase/epimerase [Clostridiales Family XIII bacterium]|jgi:2-keto-myo-inositol isomerase|nr:sugar phosphate isomerase/epimerase [Clostridiales Family XIII bacterium]
MLGIGFNEATAQECEGQSLITDLKLCDDVGFDFIEITYDCMWEYLQAGHTLDELAAWFTKHHLKPWVYNALRFFNMRDEEGRRELEREIDFIIKIADAIGMRIVVITPSNDVFDEDGNPYSIEEIRDEAVESMRFLADKIKPYGIKLALEPIGLPNCSINQYGTAYEIVEKVDRANVGLALDTFHFHAMDSHWEDLESADVSKLWVLHVNDSENLPIGQLKDCHRLWPGEGILDLKRTMEILKEKDFCGVCSIEVFRPEYYELSHEDNIRIAYDKTVSVLKKYFS